MAFHLAVYSESKDQAALGPIAAVADPSLTVAGNNIQIPDFASMLMGYFGNGVNLTRLQIQSPSLRRVVNPEVRYLQVTAGLGSLGIPVDLRHNPIQLDVAEQMQAFTSEDGAGATRMNAYVWLGDGKIDTITDPIYSVRLTAAITTIAFQWVNGAMVFDQILPVGDYAIVGARCEGASILAFRFVFQGSTPRPGGLGVTTVSSMDMLNQRAGGWGVWGIFNSTTPPTIDVLTTAVDASQIITLDLVKVG